MQVALLSAYVSKIRLHWKTASNFWIPVFYNIMTVKKIDPIILIACEDLIIPITDQIKFFKISQFMMAMINQGLIIILILKIERFHKTRVGIGNLSFCTGFDLQLYTSTLLAGWIIVSQRW